MHAKTLRKLINDKEILIAPGGYDGLSASLIQQGGFNAMYLSGASIAYTRFGRPDIGLVSMNEVAETLAVIRERVDFPIIVDGDTGFGNAINTQRTVKLFERMGASAIQLEDQVMPKRCGHLKGKALISKEEMAGKVRAAVDARENPDTMIIARTDAIAVEGFDAAIARAKAYYEAGADMLFIEAPENLEQMQIINQTFNGKVPLLANMVEGGSTPIKAASDLQDMGYSLVIFPGAMVRAYTFMAQEFLASLKENQNTKPYQDRMLDLGGLNKLLGTDEILANGQKYE
ncbi:oxaloacetate decarboxylase [Thalassomonas sp. M1454]|uniref:isocitrate lyase/PEP mutase family protein n=1 Tax=Thalassomonas sp. M1454 TaxID=2594477 RepID=UPI00117C8558|nr:isocitrate lyase/PEP mutase family protein [Thalassomonas sp. M1454]TRX55047.1 isocitrate lyase/PEP mutase family protein [Thalassomonas sp. M1454]